MRFIQSLGKVAGVVLAALGASIQFGNVFVCVLTILMGPAFVIGIFLND
jgi:hypothetical protein